MHVDHRKIVVIDGRIGRRLRAAIASATRASTATSRTSYRMRYASCTCTSFSTPRRSILIENPYLYHPTIAQALRAAKRSAPSLDVVLVVPPGRHNDSSFGQDAQEHEYARHVECGIEVHEYQNHFNHLKMAVFDERLSIHGSTNLNCRSLEDDKDFDSYDSRRHGSVTRSSVGVCAAPATV